MLVDLGWVNNSLSKLGINYFFLELVADAIGALYVECPNSNYQQH